MSIKYKPYTDSDMDSDMSIISNPNKDQSDDSFIDCTISENEYKNTPKVHNTRSRSVALQNNVNNGSTNTNKKYQKKDKKGRNKRLKTDSKSQSIKDGIQAHRRGRGRAHGRGRGRGRGRKRARKELSTSDDNSSSNISDNNSNNRRTNARKKYNKRKDKKYNTNKSINNASTNDDESELDSDYISNNKRPKQHKKYNNKRKDKKNKVIDNASSNDELSSNIGDSTGNEYDSDSNVRSKLIENNNNKTESNGKNTSNADEIFDPETVTSRDEVDSLTVPKLKILCQFHGESTSGLKKALRNRLYGYYASSLVDGPPRIKWIPKKIKCDIQVLKGLRLLQETLAEYGGHECFQFTQAVTNITTAARQNQVNWISLKEICEGVNSIMINECECNELAKRSIKNEIINEDISNIRSKGHIDTPIKLNLSLNIPSPSVVGGQQYYGPNTIQNQRLNPLKTLHKNNTNSISLADQYPCIVCKKVFTKIDACDHVPVHIQDGHHLTLFQCQSCKKFFINKILYQNHVKFSKKCKQTKVFDSVLVCKGCKTTTLYAVSFKSRNNAKEWKCSQCSNVVCSRHQDWDRWESNYEANKL